MIQNSNFFLQIEYVFDYFFSFFDCRYEIIKYGDLPLDGNPNAKLIISYGDKSPSIRFKNHIHIYESNLFSSSYLKFDSLPKSPIDKFGKIPIIYRGKNKIKNHVLSDFSESGCLIETDIDIIAGSFFMLTRYEEYIKKSKGKYDNYKSEDSIAFKNFFLNKPIVNEYIELLWEWVNSFKIEIKKRNFWKNKKFAFALTHDIDHLKNYYMVPPARLIIKNIFKNDFRKTFRIISEYFKSLIGLDSARIGNLIDIDKSYNFKSTFFIKAGGLSKYDDRYYKKKVILRKIVEDIILSGNEIAIHGSYHSYNNFNFMKSEKKYLENILNNRIDGIRQHCLKFSLPATWVLQEENNLLYDSTMTYSDNIGFRCGVCHPFRPFDLHKNKILNIWEIPLTIMDSTLLYYKNDNPLVGTEKILDLAKIIKKYQGVFVLLWHNTSICESKNPEWTGAYLNVLKFFKKQNCYNETLKKLTKQWVLSTETKVFNKNL